ncbi:hypothetical protein CCACVL1_25946 [Corchorus capsularis]|uniref:Uncharacterized protein n=1 Tax=Corchorus capsularis TaxID=210143 RepID=A0A1R3GGF5_COCAP|nr:hypothetical protein CCACVL1_25946 [Corchorus capsularis]
MTIHWRRIFGPSGWRTKPKPSVRREILAISRGSEDCEIEFIS